MSSMPTSSDDRQMQRPPVAILGAGISGLSLGRCLRQKGISSIIYDRASSAPRHTYGITLEPWAFKPLLSALNIDEATFRKTVAVDRSNPNGVGRVSANDGEHSAPFRANRHKLESMLREGQTIEQEHSLSSATMSPSDGSVELQFQNGSTLRPSQVIDTLGVHSPLRKSLLPDTSPEVQPFAVFSGKRYITPDVFKSKYAPAFGTGNKLIRNPSRADEPRLEISINDYQEDGRISISYIYSRAARNDPNVEDPLHRPDRPNAGATDIPEEFYSELKDFMTSHSLGEPFTDCFDVEKIRNERLLHWLMRTLLVPKQELLRLVQNGVVMIGDAAHALPILGGQGANMAILDAITLGESLARREEGDAALREFYEDQWPKWHQCVEDSKKRLVEMHAGSVKDSSSPSL